MIRDSLAFYEKYNKPVTNFEDSLADLLGFLLYDLPCFNDYNETSVPICSTLTLNQINRYSSEVVFLLLIIY